MNEALALCQLGAAFLRRAKGRSVACRTALAFCPLRRNVLHNNKK
jgi:hypothetical protein